MFLPAPIRCPSLLPDVRSELLTVAITGAEVKINWITGWLPCTPVWVYQSGCTDPSSPSSIFMEKDAGRTVAPHPSRNDSEVAKPPCDALLVNQAPGCLANAFFLFYKGETFQNTAINQV